MKSATFKTFSTCIQDQPFYKWKGINIRFADLIPPGVSHPPLVKCSHKLQFFAVEFPSCSRISLKAAAAAAGQSAAASTDLNRVPLGCFLGRVLPALGGTRSTLLSLQDKHATFPSFQTRDRNGYYETSWLMRQPVTSECVSHHSPLLLLWKAGFIFPLIHGYLITPSNCTLTHH